MSWLLTSRRSGRDGLQGNHSLTSWDPPQGPLGGINSMLSL